MPRKSLGSAGQSLSEESKGSCSSQWKQVYLQRDLDKDLPVAANKVVSEDDYVVLVLSCILMRSVGKVTFCWAAFSFSGEPYIYAFVLGSKLETLF